MCKREKIKGKGNTGFYRVHNSNKISYQYVKMVKGVKLCKTCETLPQAKALFEREKAQVLNGTYCDRRGTLENIYNNFLEGKKVTVGKSRLDDIQWSYKMHIAPYLDASRQMKSFTKEDIEQYIIKLHRVKISESTKILIWQVFKMLFQYATMHDYIPRDLTYGKKYIIPKEKRAKEERPYSPEEQQALLSYSHNHPDKETDTYLAFLLTIKAGLRLGEMIGLRWQDIDLNNRTITVGEQYNSREDCRTKTKGGNIRSIFINKDLLAYLSELKSTRTPSPQNYLFLAPRSKRKQQGKPQVPCSIAQRMDAVGKALGITNVHPHRGRHTFATELRIHGADKDDVSRLLGHTLQSVTDGYIYSRIGYQPNTIKAVDLIGMPVGGNILHIVPDNAKKQKKEVI